MKSRTVTVTEGERVGDVDWTYNFRQHFDNLCADDARRDEACASSVERLREIAAAVASGVDVQATTDGGWPRCGMHRVLSVGMYDGWPYWRPVPSVLTLGPLGGEWHSFASLTDHEVERRTQDTQGAQA
jgi:hypothetical protein